MDALQDTPVRQPLRAWSLILLLLLLSCLNFADKSVIGLASGPLIRELKLSPEQWGLIGSSFFFLFSCSALFLTGLVDRIGSKLFLSLLVCIWSLVQLFSVVASSFLLLVCLRIVLGASEGPAYGATLTTAVKWAPNSRRILTFALLTLGSALGPALLSPLLALLIQHSGWRMTIGLLGIFGFVWLLAWLYWSRKIVSRRVQRPQIAWLQIKQAFALFTVQTTWVIVAGFGAYWFLAFLLTWEPQYITDAYQISPGKPLYLVAVSLPWLVGGIAQVGIGALTDRLVQKREQMLVYLSTLAILLIMGACSFALVPLMPSVILAILALSFTAIIGAAFPLVGGILALRAPKEEVGTLQGVGVGLYSLAGLLAPAVIGWSVQHAINHMTGYLLSFLVGAVLMACAGVGCYCTRSSSQQQDDAVLSNFI